MRAQHMAKAAVATAMLAATLVAVAGSGTPAHACQVPDGKGGVQWDPSNPLCDGINGNARLGARTSLTINVPQAAGGKTVIGQLTMDQAAGPGFLTAYACADGPPRDEGGNINKSDLNFVTSAPVSNRLIVPADNDGNICIFTLVDAHIIVDVFGVTDDIDTFSNQRIDTRTTVCLSRGPDGTCIKRTAVPAGQGQRVPAGIQLVVKIPQATSGRTVIGQLTMDQAAGPGFFTAYACADGPPRDGSGNINKSDLNFVTSAPVSNRLIVPADNDGNICIFTLVDAHIIVDVFGVTDTITTFTNQRTDTRIGCLAFDEAGNCAVPGRPDGSNGARSIGGSELRVRVPEAVGGKTVIGQLTMDQAAGPGFFTAYACADGPPRDGQGRINKSDLNFVSSAPTSNRLIVPADNDGNICIFTLVDAHIIVDVFGVTDDIDTFANQRTDTRTSGGGGGGLAANETFCTSSDDWTRTVEFIDDNGILQTRYICRLAANEVFCTSADNWIRSIQYIDDNGFQQVRYICRR